jgi:apolipoprotein N-acyltransferase
MNESARQVNVCWLAASASNKIVSNKRILPCILARRELEFRSVKIAKGNQNLDFASSRFMGDAGLFAFRSPSSSLAGFRVILPLKPFGALSCAVAWFSPRRFYRSRYFLAMLGGFMLAASFPNLGIPGFAWIAPAVILAAGCGCRRAESFRVGYVAGLVHYLVSLYWLLNIPYRWHGVPIGPGAGWLALAAYLSIYPAIWVWLSSWSLEVMTRRTLVDSNPVTQPALPGSWAQKADEVISAPWAARMLWAFGTAALWVTLEMIIASLFSGFPWNLLGASQYQLVPLIQISSITGIYGLSFLPVWVSLCLALAVLSILRRPARRGLWVSQILLPFSVTAAIVLYGYHRVSAPVPSARTLKVTFVQPSIPQTLIWDSAADDERFNDLIGLTAEALTNKTDLLLWPEAAVPKLLRWNKSFYETIRDVARSNHVWLILGADDMEPHPGAKTMRDADYFNSSFLISPEGELMEGYRKRNLVIFGEYVPLVKWLPFIKYLTPIDGGFTPGEKNVPFQIGNLARSSVLICFEDVFPELARASTQPDTDFLVNLTNNGWFGDGAAQWQHAISGLIRAVENGVPLLRCCNNGLTCWIDEFGRMRQIFQDARHSVYGRGFVTMEIPVGIRKTGRTFYNRHGNWFGWMCVGISVTRLAFAISRRLIKRL